MQSIEIKKSDSMKIAEEKVVSLSYDLSLDNESGERVESVSADKPLKFLFGSGNLLQSFEKNIHGKQIGDGFEFTLSPDEAYGEIDPKAVVDLNKSLFVVDGQLREDLLFVGNSIPMQDSSGRPLNGKVVEIGDEAVKLDFNHPMAGKTLFFKGEIVEVRDATADEVISGYPEGMGGGCGSGGCGGGSCGDDQESGGGCGDCSCG